MSQLCRDAEQKCQGSPSLVNASAAFMYLREQSTAAALAFLCKQRGRTMKTACELPQAVNSDLSER